MSVTLSGLVLDELHTSVRERHEEVGGRDARRIEITGVVAGEQSVEGVEARLDAILSAASMDDYSAALSLRPGRRLWVRRVQFTRDVSVSTRIGSFALLLEAREPYEEAIEAERIEWPIESQNAELALEAGGNTFSLPVITVRASGLLANPSFSDGARTLVFSGAVPDGETLVLDSARYTATLAGQDVTAYTTGLFPRISPEGTMLRWADGAESSHTAAVTVELRDRWW